MSEKECKDLGIKLLFSENRINNINEMMKKLFVDLKNEVDEYNKALNELLALKTANEIQEFYKTL